jgi:hypothetical protein
MDSKDRDCLSNRGFEIDTIDDANPPSTQNLKSLRESSIASCLATFFFSVLDYCKYIALGSVVPTRPFPQGVQSMR